MKAIKNQQVNTPASEAASSNEVKPLDTAGIASQDAAAIDQQDTPQDTPAPLEKSEKATLKVGKIKVDLELLNEHLHRASCLAGNLAAIALRNDIGRIAKDMSGGGTLVATVSCLPDLKKRGLLGETDSQEGKEIVAKKIKTTQALNKLVDALCDLGLAKRS